MPLSLTGKTAIITGSGAGLGAAYASALARAGAAVVVNDVSADAANATVATVAAITADGGRAVAVAAPVGPAETARALVDTAVAEFGGLDIMVTNAGVLRDRSLLKMTDDDFDLVIQVHLRGTFTCVRAAAAHFRERGVAGRVIAVGSQWIHVDPRRAKDGPFGATIAHGFLTLALFIPLWSSVLEVTDAASLVNYGLNKVRFTSPVRAGARVRLIARIASAEPVKGGLQLAVAGLIETEGQDRPAAVVEFISRVYA